MEKVIAFQCQYCGKLYNEKSSCKSHEYRCYFNSRTRSCASCIFNKRETLSYQEDKSVVVTTCLKNNEVYRGLKTACEDYHYKRDKCNLEEMKKIRADYDPYFVVKPLLDELKGNSELELSEIKKYIENEIIPYI
ncbi:MAG: hypothetical protein KA807_11540 [Prolixibacteraceae bacterium]|nr:hypothetical protein [Prolixibacteraceae bacterium]